MGEVNTGDSGGNEKGGKHSKLRAKKSSTHIDMTPMVDLAFLLLTFFMLTTTFSKPKAMEINMPIKDPNTKPPEVFGAVTVLLSDKNNIYWYYGAFKDKETTLEKASFDPNSTISIRKLLLDKNKIANEAIKKLKVEFEKHAISDTTFKRKSIDIKGSKDALLVLVKTDDKAKYKNVVDMLDELNICNVGKFALVDISQPEFDLVNQQNAQ